MALKYVVLTLLSRESQSGYEIVKKFDTAVGYFWRASHQQVYRELGLLSDAGLASFKLQAQSDKPDKKIFRITAAGRRELVAWLEKPLRAAGNKDALLVKLLNADSDNKEILLRELEETSQRTRTMLAEYRHIETLHYSPEVLKKLPAVERILYLALRKGIRFTEAQLAWLDEALETVGGL